MVLAGDKYEGRNAGYPGNDKATEYIAKHFDEIGLKPVGDDHSYFQKFTFTGRGAHPKRFTTRNCVGYVEGSDENLKKEIVVIGAHHDHVGRSGQANAGRMRSPRGDRDGFGHARPEFRTITYDVIGRHDHQDGI